MGIAFVLWGTDNIKTYGESLAQVLWMVGVRPLPDSLGRVNQIEAIPLEELGRPRVDVVVTCSGVFRDLFINQMNLLDRAVKLVAELDEPLEMNFVRKHALDQAEELGVGLRDAATRVFSNSAGSYSANVGLAIENGGWEGEEQLQEQFLSLTSRITSILILPRSWRGCALMARSQHRSLRTPPLQTRRFVRSQRRCVSMRALSC